MRSDPRIQKRQVAQCHKVAHPDRLTADAVRISLEIWNKATRGGNNDVQIVVFRCKKCHELHVGRRRQRRDTVRLHSREASVLPDPRSISETPLGARSDYEIRYLIEEFDLG